MMSKKKIAKQLRKCIYLVCSLSIFLSSFSYAQENGYDIQMFTEDDGLPSRFIYDVIEDVNGFTWIASQDGLARFDGHEFKIYNKSNSSLIYNDCRIFVMDEQGYIWIGNYSNRTSYYNWYSCIDPEGNILDIDQHLGPEFQNFKQDSRIVPMAKYIYIANKEGEIARYKNRVEFILKNKNYTPTLILKEEPLVLNNNNTVFYFNDKFKEIDQLDFPSAYPILIEDTIFWHQSTIRKDELHNFSYKDLSGNKFPLFKNPIQAEKKINKSDSRVNVTHWNKSTLRAPYVYGFNTLMLLDDGKITVDYGDLIYKKYGPNQFMSFYDSKDRFWTWNGNGLFLITKTKKLFKTHLSNRFESVSTRGFLKDQSGDIYVFTYNGIFKQENQTDSFKLEKTNLHPHYMYHGIELNSKEFLYGSNSGRVFLNNKGTNQITTYLSAKNIKDSIRISSFVFPFIDKKNQLYFGTSEGVVTKGRQGQIFELMKFDSLSKKEPSRPTNFQEFEDGIWISTHHGMLVLDPNTKRIKSRYLSTYRIEHFHREGDLFWLATYGNGLIKWNLNTGETEAFGKDHGLINEKLMAVYNDKSNRLWVTSNKGLGCFDRDKKSFRVFLKTDGLPHNEFNFNSHFQDEKGHLFFGGLNGFISFDPDQLSFQDENNSKIIATNFNLINKDTGDKKTKFRSHTDTEVIKIESNKEYLEISFALLNYYETDKTSYCYMIEGHNDNWTFTDDNRLRINQIPYGKYKVKIKARAYNGEWSANELSIPIQINVPFYEKLINQILGFLLMLALIYFFVRWRIKKEENQNLQLQEIVNERTKELRSLNETKDRLFAILAHDLRNPVVAFESLTESLNYLIDTKQNDRVKELGEFIEKEAKQLHHLLDNLLNWALAQKNDVLISNQKSNLKEIVSRAVKNYEVLKERIGVKMEIQVPDEVFILADNRIVETVFRNILSNSFRYIKKDDLIRIRAIKKRDMVEIEFSDNGAGMTKDELKNLFLIKSKGNIKGNVASVSLGMHLCKELIELSSGDITASSNLNQGTIVTIKLPLVLNVDS